MKMVFAFRGSSGSGKSSAVKSLAREFDVIIDHDEYMIDEQGQFKFDPTKVAVCHDKCRAAYAAAIERGVDRIFLSMCLTTERRLHTYRSFAIMHGYRFVSVVVENRHAGKSIHGTPTDEVQAQIRRLHASLKL